MNLLQESFEDFTILDKSTVRDGYGGVITTWIDGATIQGAAVFNSSAQAMIAQQLGVTSLYTFVVRKNTLLDHLTVLRRESDGKIFRITSDSDDMKTPASATLDMRQYTAEEWTLPNG